MRTDRIPHIAMAIAASCLLAGCANERLDSLEQRVAKLEQAQSAPFEAQRKQEAVDLERAKARIRFREDAKLYSKEDLSAAEALYRSADKSWNTVEGKESLATLLSKYPKACRSGCALLYFGQRTEGAEQLDYLNKAIGDYGDCYYGDGVQVGPYARYVLACVHLSKGERDKASSLLEELKGSFPYAINHGGDNLVRLLSADIEASGKSKD